MMDDIILVARFDAARQAVTLPALALASSEAFYSVLRDAHRLPPNFAIRAFLVTPSMASSDDSACVEVELSSPIDLRALRCVQMVILSYGAPCVHPSVCVALRLRASLTSSFVAELATLSM